MFYEREGFLTRDQTVNAPKSANDGIVACAVRSFDEMILSAVIARAAGGLVVLFMAIIIGYSTTHNNVTPTAGLTGADLEKANAGLDLSGGVAVTNAGDFQIFNSWNWHVLCMTLAFSIAMVESILAFRAPLFPSTANRVIFHLIWQTIALAFMITGMVAIVQSKRYITSQGYMLFHMYSTHSWCGAIVLGLFTLQYVSALFIFVLFKDYISIEFRTKIGLLHAQIGRLLVLFGLFTCIVGWAGYQMIMINRYLAQDAYNSAAMLEAAIALAIGIQIAAVHHFLFDSSSIRDIAATPPKQFQPSKFPEPTEADAAGQKYHGQEMTGV